ncbi:MAG: hypothetical protein R3D31_16385 [Hyphomicrobiaceae bacterium]
MESRKAISTLPEESAGARLLSLTALALALYAYAAPHPPAFSWAAAVALVLAGQALVDFVLNRAQVWAAPLNMRKTAWLAAHLVLPLATIVVCGGALIGFGAGEMSSAALVGVILALALLL